MLGMALDLGQDRQAFAFRQRAARQDQGRRAIGIDLSAGMLRSLGDLRQSGRLSLVQADARRLPLPDQAVDVAMAMHMLYHVPDIPAAVRELRRVTKPGGTVLASTNNSDSLAEIHDLLNAAVSRQVGRSVSALPPLSFTTQTGLALLRESQTSGETIAPVRILRQMPRAISAPAGWPANVVPRSCSKLPYALRRSAS